MAFPRDGISHFIPAQPSIIVEPASYLLQETLVNHYFCGKLKPSKEINCASFLDFLGLTKRDPFACSPFKSGLCSCVYMNDRNLVTFENYAKKQAFACQLEVFKSVGT